MINGIKKIHRSNAFSRVFAILRALSSSPSFQRPDAFSLMTEEEAAEAAQRHKQESTGRFHRELEPEEMNSILQSELSM